MVAQRKATTAASLLGGTLIIIDQLRRRQPRVIGMRAVHVTLVAPVEEWAGKAHRHTSYRSIGIYCQPLSPRGKG
jgi:hypothetical protein